jgi:hypothetical protein
MEKERIIIFTIVLASIFYFAQVSCYAQGVPSFGSRYAGKPGLAIKLSDVKPHNILQEPGTLEGKWISSKKKDILEVISDKSRRGDLSLQEYCENFKDDCFVVRIKGTRIRLPLTAAYGSFNIYGADVTGEGIDSIIIESGEGRGTSVHVRSVAIYRIMEDYFAPIFEATLNGYLSTAYDPAIQTAEPLPWERYYYFKKNRQNNSMNIVLELGFKPKIIFGVANLHELFDAQARRIISTFDKKRFSYFISKIELEP